MERHFPRSMQGLLFTGARIALGAVFLYAAYDKILHPRAFAQAVYNYQILPDAFINLTALVLPWLELVLGICLVSGFWMPGAAVIGSGLLMVFISAMVFNRIRGLDVHCGCFSTEAGGASAGWWGIARDLGLLALSIYIVVCVFFFGPAETHEKGA